MFIDLPDGCCYGDKNTWNTIPVSEQKNTLFKRIIEHWIIEQNESNKAEQKLMKIEQLMNNERLVANMKKHWFTEHKTECWIMTVQCLQVSNIFVITELTVATLFAWVLAMRHQMSYYLLLCFSSGLTCGLLNNHRTPSSFVASYLTLQYSTS
jgi:hypothetical protein